MDISSIIGPIAAIIFVPIIMGLLAKVKKLQPKKTTEKSLEQLENEYSKYNTHIPLILFFIFSFAIGFLIWYVLDGLYTYRISQLADNNVYLFPLPRIAWALPAIFMSIILAAIPLHYLYLGLLGKERYAEYTEYTNLKHGIDGWKMLKYMSLAILPVCLVFSLLLLDSYIRVTKNTFVANTVFSLGEKEFGFEDIKSITLTKSFKAPNGNIVRRSSYEIEFSNGYVYNLKQTASELDFEQQQEVVNYITNNSEVIVKVNDPYPN
ncbi:hypothetical protein [Kistimonas asteriae]|uniref:hypothetical protein n=1 Tax=Kistimonas asteriae TaxID=517724 RepID=UPI001BA5125D|nr:hypothetical protein [Kistimonas asteriae]